MAGITRISDLGGIPEVLRDFLGQFLWGTVAGAPTAASTGIAATGTGSANTGALCLDRTNGVVYKNTGTKAAPVWNAVGSVSQSEIDAASLDGTIAKLAPSSNVIGAIPVYHWFAVNGGADDTQAITLTHKTKIVDFIVRLDGAGTAGGLVTVQNAGTAISDAIDISAGSDEDVFRPGQMDNAQVDVAAAADLQVKTESTGGDCPALDVYIACLRVA